MKEWLALAAEEVQGSFDSAQDDDLDRVAVG
jgi:hypothetical protein